MNIGIVGAGLSGLITGYHLKQYTQNKVTLFEQHDKVGGIVKDRLGQTEKNLPMTPYEQFPDKYYTEFLLLMDNLKIKTPFIKRKILISIFGRSFTLYISWIIKLLNILLRILLSVLGVFINLKRLKIPFTFAAFGVDATLDNITQIFDLIFTNARSLYSYNDILETLINMNAYDNIYTNSKVVHIHQTMKGVVVHYITKNEYYCNIFDKVIVSHVNAQTLELIQTARGEAMIKPRSQLNWDEEDYVVVASSPPPFCTVQKSQGGGDFYVHVNKPWFTTIQVKQIEDKYYIQCNLIGNLFRLGSKVKKEYKFASFDERKIELSYQLGIDVDDIIDISNDEIDNKPIIIPLIDCVKPQSNIYAVGVNTIYTNRQPYVTLLESIANSAKEVANHICKIDT